MVTDCGGGHFWVFGDTDAVFLHGTLWLMTIIIPSALCLTLRRLYVTRKSLSYQEVLTLPKDKTPINAHAACQWFAKVSPVMVLLYMSTTVATFRLGLLAVSIGKFLWSIVQYFWPY